MHTSKSCKVVESATEVWVVYPGFQDEQCKVRFYGLKQSLMDNQCKHSLTLDQEAEGWRRSLENCGEEGCGVRMRGWVRDVKGT
jgi:hypothetical protein